MVIDLRTPYPGTLIDDELGFRIIKCYIYKFVKKNIERRPRFDVGTMGFTSKKYFWFHTRQPFFGEYNIPENIEKLDNLKSASFVYDEEKVYFMPQYYQGEVKGKRKSCIYWCSGPEVTRYLSSIDLKDLQNLVIFNSRFTWAIDMFDETRHGADHDMDVLIYVKRPKT